MPLTPLTPRSKRNRLMIVERGLHCIGCAPVLTASEVQFCIFWPFTECEREAILIRSLRGEQGRGERGTAVAQHRYRERAVMVQ